MVGGATAPSSVSPGAGSVPPGPSSGALIAAVTADQNTHRLGGVSTVLTSTGKQ